MKPLKLTLNNFAGIASGQGKAQITVDLRSIPQAAQIVALSGPNGAGKTTIMDNLHPYRLMPSHASTPTPGGFSFYDHIADGEGSKELLWEHDGQHYLSLLRFRATAKTKKTEAYLYVVDEMGNNQSPWLSVKTGDQSDGKADTYDKAIEAILGKPEVFFQAQFSAQGKAPIGNMSATDVKRLIAEMIGANRSSELSAQASDVVRSLRPQLAAFQDELARLEAQCAKGATLEDDLSEAQRQRSVIESEIQTLNSRATELTVAIASASHNQEQRKTNQLQHDAFHVQVKDAEAQHQLALNRLSEKTARERTTVDQGLASARQGKRSAESVIEGLIQERQRLTALAETAPAVEAAKQELASVTSELEQIKGKLIDLDPKVMRMEQVQAAIADMSGKLAAAAKDGEHLVAAIEVAQSTSALLSRVPCQGTDMAGQCLLLSKANEAQVQMPAMQGRLDAARAGFKANRAEQTALSQSLAELSEASKLAQRLKQQQSDLQVVLQSQNVILATENEVKQATVALIELRKKIDEGNNELAEATDSVVKAQRQVNGFDADCGAQREQIEHDHNERKAKLEEVRKTLPTLANEQDGDRLASQLETCKQEIERAKEKLLLNGNVIAQVNAQKLRVEDAREQSVAKRATCDLISKEISHWVLLAKALGTDGIIAMSIDDAGPAISDIANALLEDCYGGRFALSLVTQTETQKGIAKETFRIKVEDNQRGETKFLETMSGGEKVWINECLVRAIALYMAQVADTRCQTLFSDESDGALDPQRKRQYMGMKRAVLERGGYDREYLITQTPELIQMCDAVIEVATL